jgi:hypothetical protein
LTTSPASRMPVMLFRITLLEIMLLTFRTLRYRLASILSTSYRFQRPAVTIGVPK